MKYPPFDLLKRFSAADAAALYASGFVTLRLGVQFQALMPQPGKIDGTYVDQIVQMVNLLATHHIHVLLDMHQDEYGPSVGVDGFPKWATQTGGAPNPKLPFPRGYFTSPAQQVVWANFWADKPGPGGVGLQERYIDGLVALAKALRSNQGLLGYTVMNEPWPGASYKTCEATTGCPALEQQLLDPFYTKVARAIRAVDPNHLIFVEPFLTFDYGGQTSLPAFASPDNALSVHPYLAQFPGQTGKAIALSTKNDDALLVTEFGATTNVTTIDNYMNGFDSEMVPWMFWQYTTIAPSSSASTNERQLAAAASMALTRPYPLAVAGTPTSYGFNEAYAAVRLAFHHSTRGRQALCQGHRYRCRHSEGRLSERLCGVCHRGHGDLGPVRLHADAPGHGPRGNRDRATPAEGAEPSALAGRPGDVNGFFMPCLAS